MKKVIKAICCILAAVILVGGGYVAGQRAKQSSIVSALPKNILDMPKESNEPSESAEPESDRYSTAHSGIFETDGGTEKRCYRKLLIYGCLSSDDSCVRLCGCQGGYFQFYCIHGA